MRWQAQPTDRSCGQTCVAMILGLRAAEVVELVGDRATWPRDLATYLAARGCAVGERLVRLYGAVPPVPLAILRVVWEERGRRVGHWVVWCEGRVLDPSDQRVRTFDCLRYGRVTSYLSVQRPSPGQRV